MEVRHEGHTIKLIADEDEEVPSESPRITCDAANTRLYRDDWAVEQNAS